MKFTEVMKVSDLSEASLRTVTLSGREVTLAKVGPDYYAFDDTCTHQQCSLASGFLEGTIIECPCHGGRFDITTGQVKALPPTESIKTYQVKVEGGSIYVGEE